MNSAGLAAPWFDVSLPLGPRLTIWPGDPPVLVEPWLATTTGAAANVSRLELGSHSGTHVDAPSHLFAAAASVDQLSLDALIGPAWLADLSQVARTITAADLDAAAIPTACHRLLLRMRNSAMWSDAGHAFRSDFVALHPSAAAWLVERGVRLVGVDYLSVEGYDAPAELPVHRTLLRSGVVIVEGLVLSEPPPGWYELICLPLRVAGCDAAPARVVLRSLSSA